MIRPDNQPVAFKSVAVNRLKCPEAHVQREFADLHSARTDFLQNFG